MNIFCISKKKIENLVKKKKPGDITYKDRRGGLTHFKFTKNDKISFIYDPPHLLKSLRNNLLKYNLLYKNREIKWKYICDAIESENPLKLKLLPKLTSRHIKLDNPSDRMKVKFATQFFSHSVHTAMVVLQALNEIDAYSKYTAEFVEDIDKLFDCVNSSSLNKHGYKLRYAMSESSPHEKHLIEMKENFKKCKFLISKRPACLKG